MVGWLDGWLVGWLVSWLAFIHHPNPLLAVDVPLLISDDFTLSAGAVTVIVSGKQGFYEKEMAHR